MSDSLSTWYEYVDNCSDSPAVSVEPALVQPVTIFSSNTSRYEILQIVSGFKSYHKMKQYYLRYFPNLFEVELSVQLYILRRL